MKIKKQLIDGHWVDSVSNKTRDIINPFNQEIIARVTESNEVDAKLAINAARQAFDEGHWPTMPATERGQVVNRIA